MITFDSVAERVYAPGGGPEKNPTIQQMKALNHITARGGTDMVGAIPLLSEVLHAGSADQAFHIMVISDGEVSDQEQTLAAAEAAVKVRSSLVAAREPEQTTKQARKKTRTKRAPQRALRALSLSLSTPF
jgi:Mg-chelatase subunit ChlD